MSENQKSILLQGNAAIDAGDHEGFLRLCTEDIVWNFVGERTLQGKQAVREYMSATYREPPAVIVDQLIADGDFLVATGKITLKDEHGVGATYTYCDVWRFRDDKITELNAFVIKTGNSSSS